MIDEVMSGRGSNEMMSHGPAIDKAWEVFRRCISDVVAAEWDRKQDKFFNGNNNMHFMTTLSHMA